MRAAGFVIVRSGAFLLGGALALAPAGADERPGVAPDTPWSCPATHPIKGYVSVESGRRVYYVPRSRFYEEASPERCYASEEEARGDGSRRAPDSVPPSRVPGVVHEHGGGRYRASALTTAKVVATLSNREQREVNGRA
ncbi:MAG TPA: hypothetical protein VGL09_17635 [Methylomirabilota bacterium]